MLFHCNPPYRCTFLHVAQSCGRLFKLKSCNCLLLSLLFNLVKQIPGSLLLFGIKILLQLTTKSVWLFCGHCHFQKLELKVLLGSHPLNLLYRFKLTILSVLKVSLQVSNILRHLQFLRLTLFLDSKPVGTGLLLCLDLLLYHTGVMHQSLLWLIELHIDISHQFFEPINSLVD